MTKIYGPALPPSMSQAATSTSPPTSTAAATPPARAASAPLSDAPLASPLAKGHDPFAQDELIQRYRPPGADLMTPLGRAPSQDAAKGPAQAKAQTSAPAVSAGELARQSDASRASDPHALQHKRLHEALATPARFGPGLFKDTNAVGLELKSVMDRCGGDRGAWLRDMLNSPGQTRQALRQALDHLPPKEREAAVETLMGKLGEQLSGVVQQEMVRQVRGQITHAQDAIEPFCRERSPQRLQLMHGMVSSQPPLSGSEIKSRLQAVGLSASDAKDISQEVLKVRRDPELVAQLRAGASGDMSGEAWDKGLLRDGALRNLDEAIHDAFKATRSNLGTLEAKLGHDQVRGDALFTNALFTQAKQSACAKLGIKEGSGAAKVIEDHTQARASRDQRDAILCAVVMTLGGLAAPGVAGAVAAAAVGSSPNVLVAQSELEASRAGSFAGSSDASLERANERKRNLEVGMAVLNLVVTGKVAHTMDKAKASLRESAPIGIAQGAAFYGAAEAGKKIIDP